MSQDNPKKGPALPVVEFVDKAQNQTAAASPVSDAVDANGKTWQEVLRFMRDNDLFDDKYDSKNLNFIYAFQMGFKSASPTPTNVQEQDELWEDVIKIYQENHFHLLVIKKLQSKYTITKKK